MRGVPRILAAAFLFLPSLLIAADPAGFAADRLVYVKDGRIHVSDPDGRNARPLSPRAETITDMRVSPSGKYLAYQVVAATRSIDQGGGRLERVDHEVTVVSLPDFVRKEAMTAGRGDPSIDHWTPEELLVGTRSDVGGTRPVLLDPEHGESNRYAPELFSSTGTARLASIDAAGGFGLVYVTTSDIKTLVGASRPAVFDLSPDGRTAAYLFVNDEDHDVIVVHDLPTDTRSKIYDEEEERKDRAALAWDETGQRLAYSNGDSTLVFDEPPEPFEPIRIHGWRSSWGHGRDLYAVDDRGLVKHDVLRRNPDVVVVPGATFGQFVRKAAP